MAKTRRNRGRRIFRLFYEFNLFKSCCCGSTADGDSLMIMQTSQNPNEGNCNNQPFQATVIEEIKPETTHDNIKALSSGMSEIVIEECMSKWNEIISLTNIVPPSTPPLDLSYLNMCWKDNGLCCISKEITEINRKDWKEIRLFVSSTFTDYFAERELLIKNTIPQLREWCANRRLNLIDIDLRWGVPAESTTETILRACLTEIERAKELNGNCFFINMLGQRYGWVPNFPTDVPESVATQFDWVPGVSVTHMEILCGAYRTMNPNALFMLRDESYLKSLPSVFIPQFVEPNWTSGIALELLKRQIKQRFGHTKQVMDYCVSVKDTDTSITGISKVLFGGLEVFGNAVLTHFKQVIEKQYPLSTEEVTALERLNFPHSNFIKKKTEVMVGREEMVDLVLRYVTADVEDTIPTVGANISVLFGKAGVGKSTVLSTVAVRLRTAGHRVLFYSLESNTAASFSGKFSDTDVANIQLMLCLTLADDEVLAQATEYASQDMHSLDTQEQIRNSCSLLFKSFEQNRQLCNRYLTDILLVDGIDSSDIDLLLRALPWPLPKALRVVIATRDETFHSSCETALASIFTSIPDLVNGATSTGSQPTVVSIELDPLPLQLKLNIIESQLLKFNKRLHPTQLALFAEHAAVSSLEWIHLACEEIRVFGAFETVTDHIRTLPDSVPGLLRVLLDRNTQVASSYGDGHLARLLRDTLLYIHVVDDGLTETELLSLLSPSGGGGVVGREGESQQTVNDTTEENIEQSSPIPATHLPYADWAVLSLLTKAFVKRVTRAQDGSDLLLWSSADARQVVLEKYFPESASNQNINVGDNSSTSTANTSETPPSHPTTSLAEYSKRAADYFQHCGIQQRELESFPLQLLKCGDTSRLSFLLHSETFHACPYYIRSRIVTFLRCPERFPVNSFPKVSAERICMTCAHRSVSGRMARLQSCFVCGTRVFTSQSTPGATETSLRLWAGETLAHRCRSHNMAAWCQGFSVACGVCKLTLPDLKLSYLALQCQSCAVGLSIIKRCCQIAN